MLFATLMTLAAVETAPRALLKTGFALDCVAWDVSAAPAMLLFYN